MAMTDLARLVSVALPNYIRTQIELPTRKSYLLSEIKKRGRETTNNGGLNIEWRPKFDRPTLNWGPGNPNVITFPQQNLWTKATLDYKTAYMGASISEIEELAMMQASANFFAKKIKNMGDELVESFPMRFAPHLFMDGTGTQKIDGLESFGGYSGTTQPGEPIANNNDTYAGLSTALGGLGGDWSAPSGSTWPRVNDPDSCDFKYHCWTPLIVNYNDAELRMDTSTEVAGWDDCWQYAMNYATTYQRILTSSVPDVWVIDPELLRRAENTMKAYSQFQLSSAASSLDPAVRVVSWNGVTFTTEFGVPQNCVYGVTFSKLELKCMGDSFLKAGTETDFDTGQKKWKVTWHGNLWVESPVYFPMLKAVTSLGT